jgi:hypothetical protein
MKLGMVQATPTFLRRVGFLLVWTRFSGVRDLARNGALRG